MAWFDGRSTDSVRDFWAAYDSVRDGLELGSTDGSFVQDLVATRALLTSARHGDWALYEGFLRELSAGAGFDRTSWRSLAQRFYSSLTQSLVAALNLEPVRLTGALEVLGDFIARSLDVVLGGYGASVRMDESEESLAFWAHALEQAEFGIVVSERMSRRIMRVNPAYAHMLGYEPEELVGVAGERLIDHSSRAALPRLSATLRDRVHHTYEMRLLRKDGTSVPVLASSSPVETASGSGLLVSTVIDASERERLERERAVASADLQRSTRRLEIVSNAAHEFAVHSGDVTALLELVARRVAEVIGDSCVVRLISDDGRWLEPSAGASTGTPQPDLGSQRQAIGEGFAGRVATTGKALLIPVIDAMPGAREMLDHVDVASALGIPLQSRGRTTGVISMIRTRPGNPYTIDDQRLSQDLADRAGLAIDNAVLVATLEKRVYERTADLQAANRELEAFSYSVSHDLRTPLRAIEGFSAALVEDYGDHFDEHGHHYIQRIRKATHKMARLIDDLLALARIGRTPLHVRSISVTELATEIASELRRRDPTRAVRIDIAPEVHANADLGLATLLLENLIGNAWKFTAKTPTAKIEVGTRNGAFFVSDNGAGFDMTFANKLFSPFQRLHTEAEFEGTGIGLATVHRIVMHHHGTIWLEAAVGRGATVFFTFGGAR